ncbi:hypothetical protein DZF91_12645 [Actinomadura logoneensis]|uniref:Uncharacterized protein n=1 Tax=Actinomadura logoneensis TaxID=2293572 RepID=A0A372JMR3_9ACTN|nr:hypothetical protein [Actinomadura logoneensis]RFU41297.1 hypothetical protein DZF91_12645 [Actinomadura logoneensis]
MGLDAFVLCRCWQDGRTTEPPVPRERIMTDDHGPYLDEGFHGALDEVFGKWKAAAACPHGDMEIARERISNWGGYRYLREAMETAGWDRFPVLREYLPESNDGDLPAGRAREALAELAAFRECAAVGTEVVLLDEDTGDVLATSIRAYGGVFVWDGMAKRRVGVDARGLFVVDESGRELFRALRCTQRRVRAGRVRFRTEDGAETTLDLTSTIAERDGAYPRRLRVVERPLDGSFFDYAVEPLRKVCEAAAETGNPVVWC